LTQTDTPYYDDGHVVYGSTQVPPLPSSDSLHHQQQHHLNAHQFNSHHISSYDGHNEVLTNSHQLQESDMEGEYSSRQNGGSRVIREIIV
jgi:hypothetical protein